MNGMRRRLAFLKEPIYNSIAVALAVVLPAVLVIRAWNAEVEKAEGAARANFEARAAQIRDTISGRLLDYEQVLRGAAGLFAASRAVGRDEWRSYYENLRLETYYPGIQGIGYAPRVTAGGLESFVGRIRDAGYSGYRIHPPGERDEYVPVAYIEPFSGRNLRAVGFDALSDPIRHEALERAMLSGGPAMSGKLKLLQETDEDVQAGVAMYIPVSHGSLSPETPVQRRQAVEGFVFAHFRVGDLMRRMLGNEQGVSLTLHDGQRSGPDALMFSSVSAGRGAPRFEWKTEIPVLGRTWSLDLASTPRFEESVDRSTPRLVLLGGVSIHLLLLAMLWSLWNTRSRALKIAGQMTREVRRREAEWQAMSDASPLGIFRAARDGSYVYVNPRYEHLSGLSAAEAAGGGWLAAVHPEDRDRVRNEWLSVIHGQPPENAGTYRFLQPGGTVIWVTALAGVIREDDGISGYVGIVEDVTERKNATDALLKSRERLGMALEGSNLALFDWDIPSGEVRLSEQWQLMMGGDKFETTTTISNLQHLVHPEDLGRLQQSLVPVLKGEARFYEVQYRAKNLLGEWRWILSRAKVSERNAAGQALRMTGTNADITAVKEVERLKNEFISTVSHELRTPLTAIIGALGLVRETSSGLDPDAAHFIEMACLNSERLSALINDVLDVEKLDSGLMALDLQPLQLREVLEHAVRINQPYADMHHASLRLLPGPEFTVAADHDRLLQVLTNLISNAAKFSPEGGEVGISAEQRGSIVRVAVRDHGPGIPENFRAAVFRRFERADNSDTRRKGGTGLGLSICKALVERMNGSIGFESEPGKGSTFYFDLPLQP
ncbi:MAG: CHASE domain-containing protein [Burkholderiales bacterium]|nr:CHASE domain-containing protein [Burkholderiales bacterium]